MQTVMIINPDYEKYQHPVAGLWDVPYAVPIDDLDVNTIFHSRIACSVPPKTGGVFAGLARECWDVSGGDQLIFLDWQKLLHQTSV